jgi:hypothetical protein
MNPKIISMSSDDYHADSALGSTGARMLATSCPAAFRWQLPQVKREFDIGNATHLLCLEPEKFRAKIAVVEGRDKKGNPSAGYVSQDAKDQRDAARLAGKIPLLPDELEDIRAMRAAIFEDPIAGVAFRAGEAEQSLFWTDPEFNVRCKTRPDWLPSHVRYLIDVKTSMSADPEDFQKAVVNYGYHQQAAWYLDGVEQVLGHKPERFAFIVVSKKPPHLVTTCWLHEDAIAWGRILNRYARGVYAWCREKNIWPSYQPDPFGVPQAFTIDLPIWAKKDLEFRHEAGEFVPPQQRETTA